MLENIHPDAVSVFQREGYPVETLPHSLDEKQLIEKLGDVRILGIRSRTRITRKVLEHAPHLWVIGVFCIGTNQIDLDACLEKGIAVFNAPYSNTRSVVELAMAEVVMLMRNIPEKNEKMHRGIWEKSAKGNHEIRGKTLGIVGYGNIGSQLSVLAESFGMNVIYYDVAEKLALGNAGKRRSLSELLKEADVVTLHVDGNPANKNLMGKTELEAMKPGARLINLSRGFVVDIPALINALDSGKLSGAALDVYPEEPASNDEPFLSQLKGMPNVILTPHIGGSTVEAQRNIADFVPGNIIRYMNTGNSSLSVNFPQLNLPPQEGAHRLIHIHENAPGVLAEINGIFAGHHINILGQYLKTNEKIGYVTTDVSTRYDTRVLSLLKNVPNTIRFRALY